MKKPFLYFTFSARAARNNPSTAVYDVQVRCANLGFGHGNDPILARSCEASSLEEGIEEVTGLLPEGVQVLGIQEYVDLMTKAAEDRQEAA